MRKTAPLLLLFVVLFAACGASARKKTIDATFVVAINAATAIEKVNKEGGDLIVKTATSEEDGKAKLAEFRAKVTTALTALDKLRQAIEFAALLDSDRAVVEMIGAARELAAQLTALGVKQ